MNTLVYPPLEIQVGQMIMVGFQGAEIHDEKLKNVRRWVKEGTVGGLIFFEDNIKSPDQIKLLIKGFRELHKPKPLIYGVDQEGGRVQRLSRKNGFKDYLRPEDVANSLSVSEAYTYFFDMADQLNEAGFNMNFGPVLDLKDPKGRSPISRIGRSFSTSGETVFHYAQAMIDAHRNQRVLTVIKHYPGLGKAGSDTHHGVADITKVWKAEDAWPFYHLIERQKVDAVMTAHLINRHVDQAHPASLSEAHVESQLRKEKGYRGVVITDDLLMGAIVSQFSLKETVVKAVQAGTDILLFANNAQSDPLLPEHVFDMILQAVKEGDISEERIQQSYYRIAMLKQRLYPNRERYLIKRTNSVDLVKKEAALSQNP